MHLVESLRYLTCTRPDILYGVGLVSHYMEKPKSTHLMAAKRILCYIKGTISYGLSTQVAMTLNSLVILTVIGQEMLVNEIALRVMFSSWVIRLFLGHQRSKLLSLFLLVKQNMLLHHLEFFIQFNCGIYIMIFNLTKNNQRRFTLTSNQLLHLQIISFFMK